VWLKGLGIVQSIESCGLRYPDSCDAMIVDTYQYWCPCQVPWQSAPGWGAVPCVGDETGQVRFSTHRRGRIELGGLEKSPSLWGAGWTRY